LAVVEEANGGMHLGLVVPLVEVLVMALLLAVLRLLVQLVLHLKEITVVMVLHMQAQVTPQLVVEVVWAPLVVMLQEVTAVLVVLDSHPLLQVPHFFTQVEVVAVVLEVLVALAALALAEMVEQIIKMDSQD
jgi:hypothetical protein